MELDSLIAMSGSSDKGNVQWFRHGAGESGDMIPIHKEDGLAPVAALRDMMRQPRNHNPSTPSCAFNSGAL